jgi:hypothetical protein
MKLGPYWVNVRLSGLVVPALLFGFGLYQYLFVRQLPDSQINLMLIEPVFILMALFTLVSVVRNTTIRREDKKGQELPSSPGGEIINKKRVIAFVVISGLYVGLMPFAGFILCNLVFIFVCMRFLGEKKWKLLIIVPVAATAAIYLTFQVWLELSLPQGILDFLP